MLYREQTVHLFSVCHMLGWVGKRRKSVEMEFVKGWELTVQVCIFCFLWLTTCLGSFVFWPSIHLLLFVTFCWRILCIFLYFPQIVYVLWELRPTDEQMANESDIGSSTQVGTASTLATSIYLYCWMLRCYLVCTVVASKLRLLTSYLVCTVICIIGFHTFILLKEKFSYIV